MDARPPRQRHRDRGCARTFPRHRGRHRHTRQRRLPGRFCRGTRERPGERHRRRRDGVAGLSIEDSTGDASSPLFEFALAVERIRAARAAIDDTASGVLLTGRSEGFIVGRPDLRETVRRLVAYAEAGADCLFAPGLRNLSDIRTVVTEVAPRPVNVLATGAFTVQQLADTGVRRISVGSGLARAAWRGFLDAAREIATTGSFASLERAVPFSEMNALISVGVASRRHRYPPLRPRYRSSDGTQCLNPRSGCEGLSPAFPICCNRSPTDSCSAARKCTSTSRLWRLAISGHGRPGVVRSGSTSGTRPAVSTASSPMRGARHSLKPNGGHSRRRASRICLAMRHGHSLPAFDAAVDAALVQLRATDESTLLERRGVGRAQIPSTVLGLLFHAAEHTQRHVGQVVTTIKITLSHRSGDSD